MLRLTIVFIIACFSFTSCHQTNDDNALFCANIFYESIDYGVKKGDINFSYISGKIDSVNFFSYTLPRSSVLLESTTVDSQAFLLKTLKIFFKNNPIDSVADYACPKVTGMEQIDGMNISYIDSDTIPLRLSEFIKDEFFNEDTYGIIQFTNPIEFKVLSGYYLALGVYTKSGGFFNLNTSVYVFRRRDNIYLPIKILKPRIY